MRRDYSRIHLDAAQIAAGEYKNHLGGKAGAWDRRGAFQLELMKFLGLGASDRLLDAGCGPIRAGVHFIRYLDAGGYTGVDFNASFVESAQRIIEVQGLAARAPAVSVLENFDFARLGAKFEWILSFSVLNHCLEEDRRRFFAHLPHAMHPASRAVVTHAGWFDETCIADTGLALERAIDDPSGLPAALAFDRWDFNGTGDRLPILQFRLAG